MSRLYNENAAAEDSREEHIRGHLGLDVNGLAGRIQRRLDAQRMQDGGHDYVERRVREVSTGTDPGVSYSLCC